MFGLSPAATGGPLCPAGLVGGSVAQPAATAAAVRAVASAMSEPGGINAANLKVAELYIDAFGNLAKTGAGSASIGMIIDGPSGRVTLVKVDGKQSGATWACLNGVLRGMQFPKLESGRTRAEFDIGI